MADESVVVSNSAASVNPDYTVAVDTVGGKEYQRVKLDGGADGAVNPITAGQQTMANSLPVVLASNQTDVPVSMSSLTPGTGATNLGKAEDAVHTSGDVGVMALAVRNSTAAPVCDDGDYSPISVGATGAVFVDIRRTHQQNQEDSLLKVEDSVFFNGDSGVMSLAVRKDTAIQLAGTDGDYVPLITDADGRLHVNVGTSALPTGAATAANQSTEITALQLIDDTIVTDNAAFTDGTTKVNVAGYIYDEVAGAALTENDAAAARINVNRAQVGVVEDGVTRGRYATVTAANALKVDGSAVTQPVSGTVSVSGSIDTELPTAAALADNTANPTVPAVGAFAMLWDGATWDRAAGTSADGQLVNLGANNDVTVTGSVTVDLTTNNDIQGQVAHDAAVSSNPLTTGLRASLATPTSVSADGDAVWQWGDRVGRSVVKSVAPTATLSNVAGSATSVTILAANTSRVGATVYNDSSAILYLKFGATASTSSFTTKIFQDGYYEVPSGYTGILDGIWSSATGSARVTELT